MRRTPTPRVALATFMAALLLHGVSAATAAGTPAQKCAAGKNKAAGKYSACRENAAGQLATSGDAGRYADAVAKCADKFVLAWQTLEAKAAAAGASCPGDHPLVKGRTDACTDTVAAMIDGPRLEDNGDGTVTDHQTGLQWEKKETALGSGVDLANAHDVDNTYVWSSSSPPNGSAFTDFLDRLNDCTSSDGSAATTAGFAGHCDWRLPTIQELQTILDATQGACGGGSGPCIDPIFGPATDGHHWTATTVANYPLLAWRVYFFNGMLSHGGKGTALAVRAVRGGW